MPYSFYRLFFGVFLVFKSFLLHGENILVVLDKNFCGEYSFANKIGMACDNLNWGVTIKDFQELKAHDTSNYDLAICLTPGRYDSIKCPKFLTLFLPDRNYFNNHGDFLQEYEDFTGYLLSFDPANYENLNQYFLIHKKRPYLYWLPTSCITNFQANNFSKLFWIEARWGNRTSEKKYKDLFDSILKSSVVDLWGPSYKKNIPFEGNKIFEQMANDGMSLVIHSDVHNFFGIPTGRIFESLAVKNIIISDKHSFVMREFGENVLYVDFSKKASNIQRQIYLHVLWVKNNNQLAREKATKAHDIFLKKFTLEQQLLQLKEMNNKLQQVKKHEI